MARREERAYREYVSDEQRSQPGCPARDLCDESLLRDTRSRRSSAAIVRSGGGKPDTTDIATSSAHTSALFDADLAGDVRAAVVVVLEAVAQVELPDGERHGEVDLEVGRQPHVRKRLTDRHRRLEIAD